MVKHENFTFAVSLSVCDYLTKAEASAALIKSESGPTMSWVTKEVTMDEMLNFCITGHSYCNLFINSDGEIYSRPFHPWNKTSDNFSGSYVVTVDVDDFSESASRYDCKIRNFVDELSQNNLAPSLWYTSFSHQPAEQKLKAHLLYVFDTMIPGRDGGRTYKILADAISEKVSGATGVPVDRCSLVASQFINPTNVNNPSLCVEYGISHVIYSFEDFGFADLHVLWEENVRGYVPRAKPLTVSNAMINDYKLLSIEDFLAKYGSRYKYIYRKEGYEWNSTCTGSEYAVVDDEYFSLYFNAVTLKDGQKRRRKIFERMCERRLLKPDVTPNQIAYCAVKDIAMFVDNGDNLLNADYLKRNVNRCFELPLAKIQQKFSLNIEYLKSKAPKRRLIYKYGVGMTQAEKARARRDINAERVWSVYDFSLSPEENCRQLKYAYNISISPSTLYNYFKEYDVDYSSYKQDRNLEREKTILHTLNEMSDSKTPITVRGLRQILKDKRIKINNEDCSRYVREYKSIGK